MSLAAQRIGVPFADLGRVHAGLKEDLLADL
jgi:hypothetical protein